MNQSHVDNLDYDNELNKRLENRNTPSAPLQPLYDIRPVATKYTMFHTVDKPQQLHPQYKSRYQTEYIYDQHQMFNPGDRAPVDYFIKNVDVESKLRSQFFALQTSPQAVYIPELNSQLYEDPMAYLNPSDAFSPTNAITQCSQAEDEFQQQSVFYNCIRNNSKK